MLALPLVATLFWHGEFTQPDVLHDAPRRSSPTPSGSGGLILVKILAPGFYARQNIRTPVKVAIATLVVTQLLNAGARPLASAMPGLALSISLAAWFNAGWLWCLMRRSGSYTPEPGWGAFLMKIAVALYLMGGAIWFAMGSENSWFEHRRRAARGQARARDRRWRALAYFVALRLMGIRLRDFARRG